MTDRRKPARLPEGSPLEYEPQNEQGVVFLFSAVARKRYGLRIEKIQPGFPDCVASRRGDPVRIEFEYRSSNFRSQGHSIRGCDWVVCWIHDWPAVPSSLRVVELRRDFKLGFNVWFQPIGPKYKEGLAARRTSGQWSVPSGALVDDLVLFYRTSPDRYVRDIFKVAGPVRHVKAQWKPGKDWMAPIRRVATLKAPLHLEQLRRHPVVGSAGFLRGSMQGRYCASQYWPEIHEMIVQANPGVRRLLARFGPERVAV